MKSIDLGKQHPALSEVIALAAKEPVLLLTPDGHQFLISEADNFDTEVEALRSSRRLQQFLDERMQNPKRIPIEEIEAEVEAELETT